MHFIFKFVPLLTFCYYFLQLHLPRPWGLCVWAGRGDSLFWGFVWTGRRMNLCWPRHKAAAVGWKPAVHWPCSGLARSYILRRLKVAPSLLGQIETQTGSQIRSFFPPAAPWLMSVSLHNLLVLFITPQFANCSQPQSICSPNSRKSLMCGGRESSTRCNFRVRMQKGNCCKTGNICDANTSSHKVDKKSATGSVNI